MPEKTVIVEWGDYGKIVTNNSGSKLLHATDLSSNVDHLVHRSAILMDVTFNGKISFNYMRSKAMGGSPVYATYEITPPAYHAQPWSSFEDDDNIYYWTSSDVPAWCRWEYSDYWEEGPLPVRIDPVPEQDVWLNCKYQYTICNKIGSGERNPEDCKFLFAIDVECINGLLYLKDKNDPTGDAPISITTTGGFSFVWTASINTTLAKPFPNSETIWQADIDLDDTYLCPYSDRSMWPKLDFLSESKADGFIKYNYGTMDVTSTVVPTVSFHEEALTNPT